MIEDINHLTTQAWAFLLLLCGALLLIFCGVYPVASQPVLTSIVGAASSIIVQVWRYSPG